MRWPVLNTKEIVLQEQSAAKENRWLMIKKQGETGRKE
jgi:hypothetical protein